MNFIKKSIPSLFMTCLLGCGVLSKNQVIDTQADLQASSSNKTPAPPSAETPIADDTKHKQAADAAAVTTTNAEKDSGAAKTQGSKPSSSASTTTAPPVPVQSQPINTSPKVTDNLTVPGKLVLLALSDVQIVPTCAEKTWACAKIHSVKLKLTPQVGNHYPTGVAYAPGSIVPPAPIAWDANWHFDCYENCEYTTVNHATGAVVITFSANMTPAQKKPTVGVRNTFGTVVKTLVEY